MLSQVLPFLPLLTGLSIRMEGWISLPLRQWPSDLSTAATWDRSVGEDRRLLAFFKWGLCVFNSLSFNTTLKVFLESSMALFATASVTQRTGCCCFVLALPYFQYFTSIISRSPAAGFLSLIIHCLSTSNS